MIVRRPQDPARFSGTVVVEWLNVTIGRDGDPSWGYAAEEIIREGHAWVGVSAQQTGVRALADGRPAALRLPRPPRRPLQLRHLHAGRPRPHQPLRCGSARRTSSRRP